ncbi:MAG: hypothetical protein WAR78_12325 [Ferruginibacter sp.]
MKKIILSTLLILGLVSVTFAQADVAKKLEAMNKIKFLLGEWEGTGWRMTQTGKVFTKAIEKVKCRLECSILIVDGSGVKTDSVTKEEKVVHDAFGIIYYDTKTNAVSMRAFTKEGITETVIEFLEEKVIRWIMEIPGGSKVRFTADFKTANKWIETGEFSRDGQNWVKFLETNLIKVKDQ